MSNEDQSPTATIFNEAIAVTYGLRHSRASELLILALTLLVLAFVSEGLTGSPPFSAGELAGWLVALPTDRQALLTTAFLSVVAIQAAWNQAVETWKHQRLIELQLASAARVEEFLFTVSDTYLDASMRAEMLVRFSRTPPHDPSIHRMHKLLVEGLPAAEQSRAQCRKLRSQSYNVMMRERAIADTVPGAASVLEATLRLLESLPSVHEIHDIDVSRFAQFNHHKLQRSLPKTESFTSKCSQVLPVIAGARYHLIYLMRLELMPMSRSRGVMARLMTASNRASIRRGLRADGNAPAPVRTKKEQATLTE